jgi:hypothetical protein
MTKNLIRFFTEPPLPPRAISIGAQYVAVAAAGRKGGRLTIRQAALEPVPPGLIEPRFAELNIKDKDRVTHLVAQALEKAGLRPAARFSLAIPRQATRTFIIGLDEVPKSKKELTEVLQWKVERLLEVTMSDLTAAFGALPPTGGGQRYLVVAAVNDILAAYEAVLAPLGIRAGFVVPAHLGEAAWLPLVKTSPGFVVDRGRGSVVKDKDEEQGTIGTKDENAAVRMRNAELKTDSTVHHSSFIVHRSEDTDQLLITADAEELTIIFLRGEDFLSIRSVEFTPDSVADEIHRTLVYYLDKLAPRGESGPEPQLETVLLIGAALNVHEVEARARALFSPPGRRPAVQALREEKLGEYEGHRLEAMAAAAALAAMGL